MAVKTAPGKWPVLYQLIASSAYSAGLSSVRPHCSLHSWEGRIVALCENFTWCTMDFFIHCNIWLNVVQFSSGMFIRGFFKLVGLQKILFL